MAQIEMVDGLMIRILSTEEAGLEKCCRLNFEFFGRAAQPPCHLSDDAAQPPWRRVAADKRHPQCRGCGNTGGGAFVQHLVHTPRHLEAWPDADRLSRLVFISRGGVRSGGMPPDAALAGGHPVFSALCSTSGVFRLRSNCV